MKRISSTRELPKEFNLSKYDVLGDMTDKDLFRQVNLRSESYHDAMNPSVKWDYDSTTYFLEHGGNLTMWYGQSDPFNEIKIDSPPESYEWMKGGKEFYEKYMENCNKSMHVSTGYGIGYLSREMLMYLSKMDDRVGPRQDKPIIMDDDEFYCILNEQSDPALDGTLRARLNDSVSIISDDGSSLLLNIDVSTPDEILLSEFKRLIPIWRKELNVEKSLSISSSWAVVRKKIIDYKVIPYIDLTIWAYANRITIPHGIMSIALFPCGERDLFSIAQTIKPFVETLMAFESLEKLKQEISK
ncbi:hypothetical protein EO05_26010 [Salmonella enterica]|uniref:Uncharacterized protein n=2 Tax=Salmonella enterica TaxID=28901 RepID=A0A1S0ZND1_SALER|nr:DUF6387 family protein [Salmonella enterica]EBW7255397.1 hypothetical protein [Salmonella enterica subsp. enterica serovar Gatow]HCM6305706.1 hypothetical protein [Salmonella enterica subsp. enterica serovar 6,14:y:1,7]AXD69886.1 hypothetical protein CHC34_02240 [Salmonella enterica]EAO9251803.1 hypothetical protein [Salmonella enterica]EAP6363930.1 hypothetical protein [Salmonella enterica]